jgi:two-component system, cell cycle response regulator
MSRQDQHPPQSETESVSLRILVSAGERHLHDTLTRWGYEIVVAADGHEALQHLRQKDPPKLAILDWEMEKLRGPEVCQCLREGGSEPYIYLILLTNESRKDELLEAFDFGADDYLVKPFDGYELRAKLIVAKRILDLQDRLICMREDLRAQATHDGLTSLWNRQACMDALASELERAKREKKPLGVIMADLDHFKQVNDDYGHLVGDAVLREVAARLKGAARSYDIVGRCGGEEFLIIIPGCDGATVLKRAEEIRDSVCHEIFPMSEGNIQVTLSMGAAASSATAQEDSILILKAADAALYRAKSRGRDRIELAK